MILLTEPAKSKKIPASAVSVFPGIVDQCSMKEQIELIYKNIQMNKICDMMMNSPLMLLML